MPQQSDPAGIIRHALEESRSRGLDSLGQLNHAVSRVLSLRPDMGRSRAESLVQDAMWPRAGRSARADPRSVPPPVRRPTPVLRAPRRAGD
jgi:hypothetical protein